MISVAVSSLIAGLGIGLIIASMISQAKSRKLTSQIRQIEISNAKLVSSIKALMRMIPKTKKDYNHANPSKF